MIYNTGNEQPKEKLSDACSLAVSQQTKRFTIRVPLSSWRRECLQTHSCEVASIYTATLLMAGLKQKASKACNVICSRYEFVSAGHRLPHETGRGGFQNCVGGGRSPPFRVFDTSCNQLPCRSLSFCGEYPTPCAVHPRFSSAQCCTACFNVYMVAVTSHHCRCAVVRLHAYVQVQQVHERLRQQTRNCH